MNKLTQEPTSAAGWSSGCSYRERLATIDDEDTHEGDDSERLTDVGVAVDSCRATMLPPARGEENDP